MPAKSLFSLLRRSHIPPEQLESIEFEISGIDIGV
jgi:hypothetical protein